MSEYRTKIVRVKEETHDVKSFFLDMKLEFVPGQYCLVSIPGREESKPFTFANTPEKSVQLTVKRVGEFTTAMHELGEGREIVIEGPRGESLNFDESASKVVFLAGGSGITPFISALRYSIENSLSTNLTLIFSNRKKKDIIYEEELGQMDTNDNINVVNTLSHNHPDEWDGETGRIDEEMIQKHVSGIDEKLWYICGPPPMVEAMVEILKELGVSSEKIKWEDWQIPGKH